jgi:hypothetical protein
MLNQLNEFGALLGREDLCRLGNGFNQSAGGRVGELQCSAANALQGVTADGWLHEGLTQGLPVLTVLLPQRQEVFEGGLRDGLDLLALLLSGIDAV